MVRTKHDAVDVDVDVQPLWGTYPVVQQVLYNPSKWYIPKLLHNHRNHGTFYVTDTAVLIRELYEFGYIDQNTLHDSNTHIMLTYMKLEVEKSGEPHLRSLCSSLSHMSNRSKDAKDVYFGILGYDIRMYPKYSQDLSRKTTHAKFTGNTHSDFNTSGEEEGGSRNSSGTRRQSILSQEETSSFMKM